MENVMETKPSLSINPYNGLVEYNYGTDVLEFIREDIEQICSVILDDADLNVMRLQQLKWKWWYLNFQPHIPGSHTILLQYREEPDSTILAIGKDEAELLRSFIEPITESIACLADYQ
jgi:hypothetical protein